VNTQHLCAEVCREAAHERTMEMREAEDAPTANAGTSLEKIHTTTALIAIGRQVRITEEAEDSESRHRRRDVCVDSAE